VQRYKFYGIGKYFTSQGGPVRPTAELKSDLPEGCYSFIWPNFSFNLFPGAAGAVTMLWIPQAVDRTLAVFDFFYADEVDEEEAKSSTEFVDQVQREDIVVCESVQRGLESGILIQGRLNTDISDPAKCEIALQHFQKLVFRALSGQEV
jgi:choline monooxygenase